MNGIDTLYMDLFTRNEEFARGFCGGWEQFYPQAVERVIEEVLEGFDTSSTVWAMEEVQLDLGVISETEFRQQFPIRLRQALEEFLNRERLHSAGQILPDSHSQPSDDLFQAFIHWLLYGSWAWHLPDHFRHPGRLFFELLKQSAASLRRFLQQYGHYTSVQQRLVWYLDDDALEKGVELLAPSETTFICSYVRWLRRKYELRRQSGIRQTEHRHTVWMVVYGWLLRQYSPRFHQKTFIIQTLTSLAWRYNTTYGTLLRLLTEEIERFSTRRMLPAGLFPLLQELLYEQQQDDWTDDPHSLSRLCLQWSHHIQEDRLRLLSPAKHKQLIACLSRAASCRLFLRGLTEKEIFRLLKQVAPQQASFVGATSVVLDRGEQQGMLQGKTGGDFRLLKWQLIFPLLLDKRGRSGFNQRAFLLSLLSGIAAHYNLTVADLLEYLCVHLLPVIRVDRSVQQSLHYLYQVWVMDPRQQQSGRSTILLQKGDKFAKEASHQKKEIPVPSIPVALHQRRWYTFFFPKQDTPAGTLKILQQKYDLLDWLSPVLDIFYCIYSFAGIADKRADRDATYIGQAEWTRYLLHLLTSNKTQSREEAFLYLLDRLWSSLDRATLQKLWKQISRESSPWWAVAQHSLHRQLATDVPVEVIQPDSHCFVRNAGVVLLSPYLPVLFDRLKLTSPASFPDKEAQVKAAYLIQYLVWGHTAFPEPELSLNKLLTGIPATEPLPPEFLLSDPEKETADSMIRAVLSHWEKLKGTSVEGFRESFLQREGRLEQLTDHYLLSVESRAYDMLLDTLPWSYHPIRWSWMGKSLQVKWR